VFAESASAGTCPFRDFERDYPMLSTIHVGVDEREGESLQLLRTTGGPRNVSAMHLRIGAGDKSAQLLGDSPATVDCLADFQEKVKTAAGSAVRS
jgi:hypothetical protein